MCLCGAVMKSTKENLSGLGFRVQGNPKPEGLGPKRHSILTWRFPFRRDSVLCLRLRDSELAYILHLESRGDLVSIR